MSLFAAHGGSDRRRSAGGWADRRARSVLVVLHDLPLGGSERIAIRLANQWAALGRDVTLLCGSLEGPLRALVSQAVTIRECRPAIPRARGSRRRLGEATAAYIAARRPDVLFVPGNYHWPILPAVARLPRALRPVVVAQISTPLYRPGRGPIRQVEYNVRTRRNLACADVAVSLSRSMTADADRVLRRPITRAVRLPALDETVARPVAPPAEPLILCAGRLAAVKGFDLAIKAFAALDIPQARMAIVGEGPLREPLTALARSLGVEARVSFPGYVPDIRPWLDRARLLLLTSVYEGYAAVVVEALAAGRPVVATDCTPAASELLDHADRGQVVAGRDPQTVAAALAAVLKRPAPDPQALAESVRPYQMGPIAEAYLDIFDAAHARRQDEAADKDQRRRRAFWNALRPSSARVAGETT